MVVSQSAIYSCELRQARSAAVEAACEDLAVEHQKEMHEAMQRAQTVAAAEMEHFKQGVERTMKEVGLLESQCSHNLELPSTGIAQAKARV